MKRTVLSVPVWVYLSLFILGVLAGFVRDFSRDFHWHVVVGDWMLSHRQLLRTDVFSYSFAGHRQYLDSWLGDVLLALAFKTGSYPACYLLRGICLGWMLVLLCREMVKIGIHVTTAALLLAILLSELLFRFYLRPETLTFLLLAYLLAALGEHERSGKWRSLVPIPFIIIIWSNLHGSELIGLLAIGIYSAEQFVKTLIRQGADYRKLGLILLLPFVAFIASVINPEGLREPLMFLYVNPDDPTFKAGIEWGAFSLSSMSPTFLVIALGIAATTVLIGSRISVWRVLLVVCITAVAFQHGRFIKAALICAAPLLACNLSTLRKVLSQHQVSHRWRWVEKGLIGLLILWVPVLLFGIRNLHRQIGLSIDTRAYPEVACRFAHQQKMVGRMLNSFDFGSYLLFCLPEHRVLIDQRAATLYSAAFTRKYYELATSNDVLRSFVDQMGITWAFMAYDPLAQLMASDPQKWRLIYFDDLALIYVRTDVPALKEKATVGFRYIDPAQLMHITELQGAPLAEAKVELKRQQSRCPNCYRTRLAAAGLALAGGNQREFLKAFGPISQAKSPAVVFLAGVYDLSRGKTADAARLFAYLRKIGGDKLTSMVFEAKARAKGGDREGAEQLLKDARQLSEAR